MGANCLEAAGKVCQSGSSLLELQEPLGPAAFLTVHKQVGLLCLKDRVLGANRCSSAGLATAEFCWQLHSGSFSQLCKMYKYFWNLSKRICVKAKGKYRLWWCKVLFLFLWQTTLYKQPPHTQLVLRSWDAMHVPFTASCALLHLAWIPVGNKLYVSISGWNLTELIKVLGWEFIWMFPVPFIGTEECYGVPRICPLDFFILLFLLYPFPALSSLSFLPVHLRVF